MPNKPAPAPQSENPPSMDVVYYGHDTTCHPQLESIAAKPDTVAERYE